LQQAVSSGWVRGAVTGLGLLNLTMAFWEMFHFRDTVRRLQGLDAARAHADAPAPAEPHHLPDYERRER
jgi:predicted membrane-bound spermidine synthase